MVFCASSLLVRPLLQTDNNEWSVYAEKVSFAKEGVATKLEPLLAETRPGSCRLTHSRLLKYITVLVILVCLASLGAVAMSQYADELSGANRPPSFDSEEFTSSDDVGARALMMKYIKVRMTNDMDGFKKMIDPDATMKIDVSKASYMIRVGARRSIPKLNMVGWEDIGTFYANNRAQPNDKIPGPRDISCVGNTCQTTFVLKRGPSFFPVTLHMDSVFRFNLHSGLLDSIGVTLT